MPKRRDFLTAAGSLLTFGLFTQRVMAEVGVGDPTDLTAKRGRWYVWGRKADGDFLDDNYEILVATDSQEDALLLARMYAADWLRGSNLQLFYWRELIGDPLLLEHMLPFLSWCRAVVRARQGSYERIIDEYLVSVGNDKVSISGSSPPDFDIPDDLTREEAWDFVQLMHVPMFYVAAEHIDQKEALADSSEDKFFRPVLDRYWAQRHQLGFMSEARTGL